MISNKELETRDLFLIISYQFEMIDETAIVTKNVFH